MNRGVYDAERVTGPELCSNDAACAIHDVVGSAIERASEAARGIRSGLIVRGPLSKDSCKFCGALSWCKEAIT